MTGAGEADAAPRRVEIRGLPLAEYREAAEHHDELRREFALIRGSLADEASVPARLLRLIAELETRFAAVSAVATAEIEAALDAGRDRIDLTYELPGHAREAIVELEHLLDEADAYCRAGHLLTLTTPPRPLAFRRWFLGEFVRQLDGGRPTPWPDRRS